MFGQDFRGFKDAVDVTACANHALVFLKQVRQNPCKVTGTDAPPSVTTKVDTLAMTALNRPFLDQAADAKHFCGVGVPQLTWLGARKN